MIIVSVRVTPDQRDTLRRVGVAALRQWLDSNQTSPATPQA